MALSRVKSVGIAVAAFVETVRQPVFFLAILLGSGLLFASSWITLFGFGREAQIVRETGVAGAVVAGLFIAFVTVPGTIAEEIQNKQILAILAKPVKGFDLVLGKFLGLAIALGAAFVCFYVAFAASLFLKEGSVGFVGLFQAYAVGFLQVLVVSSVVLFFSVWLPAAPATICAFAVFAGGNLIPYFSKRLEGATDWSRVAGEGALLLLPDLFRLNLAFDFASGRTGSALYLFFAALYAATYVTFVLAGAGTILSRKEMA